VLAGDRLAHQPADPAAAEQATAAIAQRVADRARYGAVLLDGLIAPTGERRDRSDLFTGKHRVCGMNVQVIADLDGRVIDTGVPIGGSRHDSVAFDASGLADRWATHLADGGPGMLADKGYQAADPPPRTASHPAVRSPKSAKHATTP
jgi:hypothetical protein